jgi:hypothetical protein
MPGPRAGLFVFGRDRGCEQQDQDALSPIEHIICFENVDFDLTLLQNRH